MVLQVVRAHYRDTLVPHLATALCTSLQSTEDMAEQVADHRQILDVPTHMNRKEEKEVINSLTLNTSVSSTNKSRRHL